VLHDQDRWSVAGKAAEQRFDGLRSSRGRPDDDQTVRPRERRRLGLGQRRAPRPQRGQEANRSAVLQQPDAALQAVGDLADGIRATGLGDDVDGAGRQRLDADVGSRRRQRTHDDDGQWVVLHQPLQERESVHPRHLDIERQHVRIVAQDEVAGDEWIRRDTDDLDIRFAAQHIRQHFAHDGRIVDH